MLAQLRSIPRIQRSERLRTMRWYRRQRLAHDLRRARLELAARRLGPPVFLMVLGASALTLLVVNAVKWLHG